MTNDQASFLRAIASNPADDAPRLVYADWLHEQGDEDRAEFIRRQIALAHMKPWDVGYTSATLGCDALLQQHPEWLGTWESQVRTFAEMFNHDLPTFARGFIHHVKVDPVAFRKHHRVLLNEFLIQQLLLDCTNGLIGRDRDWPKFRSLRELEILYSARTQDSLRATRLLDGIASLDHFGIRGCRLDFIAGATVIRHRHMLNLNSLCLAGTPWPAEVEPLFRQAEFPALRHLTHFGSSDMVWLAAPWVRSLEVLQIRDVRNTVTSEERSVIADVLPETDVQSLRLNEWNFDSVGAERFAWAVNRSSLESLALGHTRIDPHLLAGITSQLQRPLRALIVTGADLQDDFVQALLSSPMAESLRLLWLNRINRAGLQRLSRPHTTMNIESLRLGLSPPYEGVATLLGDLLSNPSWATLKSLTLYMANYTSSPIDQQVSEAWVNAVVKSEHPLEELRLDLRRLSVKAAPLLKPLATRPTFKRLFLRGHDEAALRDDLRPEFGHRVVHHYSASYM